MKYSLWFSLCFFLFSSEMGITQTLDDARQLAQKGQHKEADRIFTQLLSKAPGDSEVMVASAYNHAWWGQHTKALLAFREVLDTEPNRVDALSGMGYALAWSGQYAQAKIPFKQILKVYPDHAEGLKGLGYVYLWQGEPSVATMFFQRLVELDAFEPEYHVALGQAALLDGSLNDAEEHFLSALSLNPNYADALLFLDKINTFPTRLAFDVWTGQSRLGDEKGSWGLRAAQVSWRPKTNGQIWLRYDNTLSQDNLLLLSQNRQLPGVYLGGMWSWKSVYGARFELGQRQLPTGQNQYMLLGETNRKLPLGMVGKLGGLWGITPEMKDDWMAYAGLEVPLSSYFSIEPTIFHARTTDLQVPETRLQLGAKLKNPQGYELSVAGIFGQINAEGLPDEGKVVGLTGFGLLPIAKTVWIMANVRYEKGVFEHLTTYALGVRVRIP